MTKNSPAATDRWAVSTRTHGGLLTASVSLPAIQMVLLGIPQGFTPVEIQSWLKDLAGVAIETSRSDQRVRPIPSLLHHALTGLLFSQTELWSHTGHPLPCAVVFVDGPQGMSFGWVGRARAMLLVSGEPFEPQWVIVRDEAGHEAMSAALAPEVHALLTLEYRPQGEDGTQAPGALDAECGLAYMVQSAPEVVTPESVLAVVPDPDADTKPVAGVLSAWVSPSQPTDPNVVARAPRPPAPESLPMQQPGLAPAAALPPAPLQQVALDRPDAAQALPSTYHASASTFAMPALPGQGTVPTPPAPAEVPSAEPPPLSIVQGVAALGAAPAAERGAEPGVDPAPPALWSPEPARGLTYRTLSPSATPPGVSAPVALPASLTTPAEPLPPPSEPDSGPGHPVGRWLSRLMGFGRKPTARLPESMPETPLSDYDAMLSSTHAPHVADAPAVESTAPFVDYPSVLPLHAPADISEPHALPAEAGHAAPPQPAPQSLRRGGLTAAGLNEILGAVKAPPPPLEMRRMEGLTAVSAASGPIEMPPGMSAPESGAPGSPPYPMLEVTPPQGATRGPIEIEREPVAADSSFGIPRLPQRETPKPVRAPAPELFVVRGTGAPPPAPGAPPPPPLVLVGSTTQPPPSEVPEPPAEFLAEFEASLRVEPVMDPTLPAWPREIPADPRTAQPPALPPMLRGTVIPTRPVPAPPGPPPSTPTATPRRSPPSLVPPVAGPPSPPFVATPPVPMPAPAAPASPTPAAVPSPVPPAAAAEPVVQPQQQHQQPQAQPQQQHVPAPAAPVLRAPSAVEPTELAAADVAALMRELPLPTRSTEMRRPDLTAIGAQPSSYVTVPASEPVPAEDIPEGMLVAQQATARPKGARSRVSPWPLPDDAGDGRRPLWRNPVAIVSFVLVLFGVGWWVGHAQSPDNDVHATPTSRLLRAVGLGGARFNVSVDSDPPGAWIGVDGKDVARRTPATLELTPGEHAITLSMPDLGNVKVAVNGSPGQKVKVSEALHGALEVTALDPSVPVKMSLDGQPQGFLPVHVDRLPPGLHEVQFSGPNMQPWGQNVNIPIRQTTQLVARPMMSPATGVVQVQASLNDDNGTAPLAGANVFVDGELRGATPLTLELPRGPHSLRVTYHAETAPVQVIDLPGGNQRFASFQFGLDSDLPPLKLQANYAVIPADKRGTTVSASLDGLDVKNVREAWLHVRTPDGMWRRYDMTVTRGARGAMLSAVFPNEMFDAQGRATWYASAATAQGDEFFTEVQRSAH